MKGVYQNWNEEQIQFIFENYKKLYKPQILEAVNKLGEPHTYGSLKRFYAHKHLVSGLPSKFVKGGVSWNKGRKMSPEQYEKQRPTMFKKGIIPHNTKAIGDLAYQRDSSGCVYVKRKIAEPDVWILEHRRVWEEHNGKIPKGYVITFLDGNTLNCDINNLVMLTKEELCKLNRFHNKSNTVEQKKCNIAIAKVETKIDQIIREVRNAK